MCIGINVCDELGGALGSSIVAEGIALMVAGIIIPLIIQTIIYCINTNTKYTTKLLLEICDRLPPKPEL